MTQFLLKEQGSNAYVKRNIIEAINKTVKEVTDIIHFGDIAQGCYLEQKLNGTPLGPVPQLNKNALIPKFNADAQLTSNGTPNQGRHHGVNKCMEHLYGDSWKENSLGIGMDRRQQENNDTWGRFPQRKYLSYFLGYAANDLLANIQVHFNSVFTKIKRVEFHFVVSTKHHLVSGIRKYVIYVLAGFQSISF